MNTTAKSKLLDPMTYNTTIVFFVLWGVFVNYLMFTYCTNIFIAWNPYAVLIGLSVAIFIGMFVTKVSTNPVFSFIEYNLVVALVGVFISLFLKDCQWQSILYAITMSGTITFLILFIGMIKPDIFTSMSSVLFLCLLGVFFFEFLCDYLGIIISSFWDWVVAVIISLLIGYEWVKAQELPPTLNSALEVALKLYLQVVYLFIFILSARELSK